MKSDLKAALDKLSAKDLVDARAYIGLRVSNGMGRTSKQQDTLAADCIEVICATMRARGSDMTTPTMLTGKSKQYREFRRKLEVEGLGNFLRDAVKNNRVAMRGLLALVCDLMADYLERVGDGVVSSTTIMNHFHRVPAVLNSSFPGYAQSGLLNLVVRSQDHVRKERDNETLPRRDGEASRQRNLVHDPGRGTGRRNPRRIRAAE